MRNHSKPCKNAFCVCRPCFQSRLRLLLSGASETACVYYFPVLQKLLTSTAFQCFKNCLRLLLSGASKATAIRTA